MHTTYTYAYAYICILHTHVHMQAARLLVARLCWRGRLPGGRAGVGGAVSRREAEAASVALNLMQVRARVGVRVRVGG